jgi:hypothetical protein
MVFELAHAAPSQTGAGQAAIQPATADAAVIESGAGQGSSTTREGKTEAMRR